MKKMWRLAKCMKGVALSYVFVSANMVVGGTEPLLRNASGGFQTTAVEPTLAGDVEITAGLGNLQRVVYEQNGHVDVQVLFWEPGLLGPIMHSEFGLRSAARSELTIHNNETNGLVWLERAFIGDAPAGPEYGLRAVYAYHSTSGDSCRSRSPPPADVWSVSWNGVSRSKASSE